MKFTKYESRFKAGEILAESVFKKNCIVDNIIMENPEKYFCFAIPNGGVPVAEGFCSILKINYDVIIVRKIKIPFNTEAGFGSVTSDGSIFINESLLNRLTFTALSGMFYPNSQFLPTVCSWKRPSTMTGQRQPIGSWSSFVPATLSVLPSATSSRLKMVSLTMARRTSH